MCYEAWDVLLLRRVWQYLPSFLLGLVAAVAASHYALGVLHTLAIGSFADTPIFVENAHRFLHTAQLYDMTPPLVETYSPTAWAYKFTPLYSLPYLPFLRVGQPVPEWLYQWFAVVHIARYVMTMLLCGWFFGPRRNPRWWAVIVTLFSLFSAWAESLFGLTFDNLYLFLVVISLVLLQSRWQMFAAWPLAYVAMAKLFPAVQLLVFVGSRSGWALIWRCGTASLVLLFLSLWAFGMDSHIEYYSGILPVLLREEISTLPNNLSLFAWWSVATGLPKAVFILPVLLVTTAGICWSRSQLDHLSIPEQRRDIERLLFVWVIPVVLLLLTNCWGNYQLVLLVLVSVLAGSALLPDSPVKSLRLLLVLGAMAMMLPSANYTNLSLPYIDYLWAHHHNLYEKIIRSRCYLPLWLWSGTAIVLWVEVRRAQRKNQIL